MGSISHAAERKAFEIALDSLMKKAEKNRSEGYVEIVNMIEKVLKDGWKPEAYERLRQAFSKDGKWTKYFNNLLDSCDLDYLKGLMMAFGYEGGFRGFRETQKNAKKLGVKHIPWIILFDPTSACNLRCTGCWAAEYKNTLNLSYDDMDSIAADMENMGIVI